MRNQMRDSHLKNPRYLLKTDRIFIAKNQNKSGNNQKQRPNEIGKMLRPANNICQAKQNANSNQNESDIFVFVRKQKNCTNDKWIVFKIKNNI